MGWRFRRRLRLIPGVTLNLGKRGASVSLGVPGAHVTYGAHGRRTTVGLPGTGLSYTDYQPNRHPAAPPPPSIAASAPPSAPAIITAPAVAAGDRRSGLRQALTILIAIEVVVVLIAVLAR